MLTNIKKKQKTSALAKVTQKVIFGALFGVARVIVPPNYVKIFVS